MLRVRFPFHHPLLLLSAPVFSPSTDSAGASTEKELDCIAMAIGCDPELRLSLGGATAGGGSNPAPESSVPSPHRMTIFYNGKLCVCDATEVQARAILSMAKKEMEELAKKKNSTEQEETVESAAALPRPEILNPAAGLSMKRSLQRFLQKRKARISDVSPYNQKPKLLLFPISSQQQE